ncbi:hypothetical protein ABZ860_37950 [Microbispora sp. NPDC046973]|uniref:hypothetical protein n=1 Tax=Microbispora sp. NPDC046973 TaxID=3155022 RepID=UPI0033E6CDA5
MSLSRNGSGIRSSCRATQASTGLGAVTRAGRAATHSCRTVALAFHARLPSMTSFRSRSLAFAGAADPTAGAPGRFATSLALVAQRKRLLADDVAIDSKVMLIPTGNDGFKPGVELNVRLPSIAEPAQAADLVRVAHQVCPCSNATRGDGVALADNGTQL